MAQATGGHFTPVFTFLTQDLRMNKLFARDSIYTPSKRFLVAYCGILDEDCIRYEID